MTLAIDIIALVIEYIVSYCQRRTRQCYICHSFHSKEYFTSCTLLTTLSASVYKSGHAKCSSKVAVLHAVIILVYS